MGDSKEPCAFCPAPAEETTGEHLWSAWAGTLFGPRRRYTMHRLLEDGRHLSWRKRKLDEKAYVVCGDCNHGWMSEIENQTKAVIADMVAKNSPKALNESDLATLAIFLMLKSIVCDHMSDQPKPFYSFSERRSFRNTPAIPKGVQIWLAATPAIRGMFKAATLQMPLHTANRFESHVFTYGLGYFVAQLTSTRWVKKSRRRHARPPALRPHFGWIVHTVPMWPNPPLPVSWPPRKYMTGVALDEFVDRWKRLKWADNSLFS
jgi:hypothetical protein